MVHGKKNRKITTVLICVSLLLLAGCGNGRAGETAEEAKNSENTGGMGRYVEDTCELPKEINRNGGLNVLSDGSMTIISYNSGLWRSRDGGAGWQQEETAFFPMMQNVYALSAVMAPDGTVAVTCSGAMPDAAREVFSGSLPDDWEGNYCIFVSPAGDIKVVDFGFTQADGSCLSTLCFKADGRLFAGDMNGRIYEIDMEHESLKELFMMEREIGSIGFCGDVLMAVAPERLYLYDLAKKEMMPGYNSGSVYQKYSGGREYGVYRRRISAYRFWRRGRSLLYCLCERALPPCSGRKYGGAGDRRRIKHLWGREQYLFRERTA